MNGLGFIAFLGAFIIGTVKLAAAGIAFVFETASAMIEELRK